MIQINDFLLRIYTLEKIFSFSSTNIFSVDFELIINEIMRFIENEALLSKKSKKYMFLN